MAKSEHTIAIEADPNDPEDFPVTEGALQHALTERRARRGRPAVADDERKRPISIRMSPRMVERLRATGPGWQTRAEAALAEALEAGRI